MFDVFSKTNSNIPVDSKPVWFGVILGSVGVHSAHFKSGEELVWSEFCWLANDEESDETEVLYRDYVVKTRIKIYAQPQTLCAIVLIPLNIKGDRNNAGYRQR